MCLKYSAKIERVTEITGKKLNKPRAHTPLAFLYLMDRKSQLPMTKHAKIGSPFELSTDNGAIPKMERSFVTYFTFT